MLLIYQATSVDATALGAFSCFMFCFGYPLACLQTRLHPWHHTERVGGWGIGEWGGLKLQLIMMTSKSARRQLQRGDDKTHVCLITMGWKIGKAAVVDRESYPQSDGVNDATPVLSVSSLSRNWASPFQLPQSLEVPQCHTVSVWQPAFSLLERVREKNFFYSASSHRRREKF